jgi:hypothetical protein
MRKTLVKSILIVAICFAGSTASYAQRAEAPLTNGSIVKLVRAGFKEKTVIAIIQNRPNRFNLDPDRLIELKRNGVSDNIVLAMLAQDDPFIVMDDEWTLTPGRNKRVERDNQPHSGGSGVFGSSGGSKGQTDGRGLSGANENDTTTTGTATVRILRSPSEAGGAALKLEKTPTLTNESVIKLVEAGFSEGTIIKQIEDSPADFDLSASKLQELRKRRVTDPIIDAMTSAMSDDPDLKPKAKRN